MHTLCSDIGEDMERVAFIFGRLKDLSRDEAGVGEHELKCITESNRGLRTLGVKWIHKEEKKETQTQGRKNDGEEKITKHGENGCYA